jgi:hypothetical protein
MAAPVTDLTPQQRVERANRAKRAMEEFLDPAFELVMDTYLSRVEELSAKEPWSASKITALANATRIAREVRSQIEAIVRDEVDARAGIKRAQRIEELSPARRRLLQIGPF